VINSRRGCFACTKDLRDRAQNHQVATLAFDTFGLYLISSQCADMTTHNMHDDVPGTEYLVDTNHNLDVSHAGSGESDIVLLPQPTSCGRDPLVSLAGIFD
jgi:hypothetical protein